jgi:hypothetical protein
MSSKECGNSNFHPGAVAPGLQKSVIGVQKSLKCLHIFMSMLHVPINNFVKKESLVA